MSLSEIRVKVKSLIVFGVVLGLLAAPFVASAATTGTEFEDLYNLLVGWATGFLGKSLAIGSFLIGAITGVVKSTAVPALIGVIFAIIFGIGPGIIDGMMTAVI